MCCGTLEPPNSTGVAMAEGLQGSGCAKEGALDSPWPPTEAWLGCGVWKPAQAGVIAVKYYLPPIRRTLFQKPEELQADKPMQAAR